MQMNSKNDVAGFARRKILPIGLGQTAHQVERNPQITRLHESVPDFTGKDGAVRRRRGRGINRRVRLLYGRRAEFEIFDLPELACEIFDVRHFENFDEHADAFFKARSAFAGIDSDPVQYPRMAATDAYHDPPLREQIRGGNLARQNRRMMRRRADDPGQKANARRALCRSDVESQRERRAGKQILSIAFRCREEVEAQLVCKPNLLQDLRISLLLGFSGIRKFGKQTNLHLFDLTLNLEHVFTLRLPSSSQRYWE